MTGRGILAEPDENLVLERPSFELEEFENHPSSRPVFGDTLPIPRGECTLRADVAALDLPEEFPEAFHEPHFHYVLVHSVPPLESLRGGGRIALPVVERWFSSGKHPRFPHPRYRMTGRGLYKTLCEGHTGLYETPTIPILHEAAGEQEGDKTNEHNHDNPGVLEEVRGHDDILLSR